MRRPSVFPIALCLLFMGYQPTAAPPAATGERKPADHIESAGQRLPNPADEKCMRDGYEIRPILVNGIPVDSECVNPDNGKTCKTWAYFRNECRF